MKKLAVLFALAALITCPLMYAQVSPYQIPPKWMFGYKAGFDFGTSPATNSPPLVLTGNPTDNSGGGSAVPGLEESSSACDPSSNLAVYSNQVRYYNSSNTGGTLTTASSTGSSTDGVVIVPDPGNSNQYYIFTANDQTGGGGAINKGINYYIFNSSTNTISGSTNLIGNTVDESLCAGSDGNSGYWIVAHSYNSPANGYYVWHVTSTGVAQHTTFPQSPASAISQFGNNASIKINKCQDRIAYSGNGGVEVYSWDRATGTIGTNLLRKTGLGIHSYGLEFSPSGRFIYYSDLTSNNFYQVDVNTPASSPVTVSSVNSNSAAGSGFGVGTLQLGPDNKIYVTNPSLVTYTGAVYIGVINSPDVLDLGTGPGTGCNYNPSGFTLKPNNGANYPNIYLGIANMAWMTPQAPAIITSSGGTCSKVTHTIDFKTYFGTSIDVLNSSVQWSFDNGSTWTTAGSADGGGSINPYTYDYGGSVSTTAKVKFKDQSCNNYTWTASIAVTTTCTSPVKISEFYAQKSFSGVLINWTSAQEINNDYFEVQKSSDGIHFSTFEIVKGNANSSSPISYSLIDTEPYIGQNYYRLVQHDFDGRVHYSEMVNIELTSTKAIVYPNPSSSSFTLKVPGCESVYLIISDMTGKELFRGVVPLINNEFSFGENLPSAPYILQLISGNDIQTIKVDKR